MEQSAEPPLATTTVLVVLAGLALPFSPLAARLGFVNLPGGFFIFLAAAVATYMVLVELVKGRVIRTFLIRSPASISQAQATPATI